MEQIIFKLLPALMWIGFGLRLFKHNIDQDYIWNLNSAEGRRNVKYSVWSGIIVAVFFVFAIFIKADDNLETETLKGVGVLLAWMTNYLFWGWAIDSVFLSLMKLAEKRAQKQLDVKEDTINAKLPKEDKPVS